jgi:hypothetical protein
MVPQSKGFAVATDGMTRGPARTHPSPPFLAAGTRLPGCRHLGLDLPEEILAAHRIMLPHSVAPHVFSSNTSGCGPRFSGAVA